MRSSSIKKFATILLVILVVAPFLGTAMQMVGQDAETNQYALLQWIVMGVYNLPFVIVSFIGLQVCRIFDKKQNKIAADVAAGISIAASLAGIVLMLGWGRIIT